MPSRPDRVRVWAGEIKRTRGGLTKDDLVRNKKGKIVSRRRSAAAKASSNLGAHLRKKGQGFARKPEPKKPEQKDRVKPKPVVAKKQKVVKAAAPAKPKPAPKQKGFKHTEQKPKSFDRTKISVHNIAPRRRSTRAKRVDYSKYY